MASSIPIKYKLFLTDLLDPSIEAKQVLPLWVKVDLGVMAIKGYFTLPRSTELKSHH